MPRFTRQLEHCAMIPEDEARDIMQYAIQQRTTLEEKRTAGTITDKETIGLISYSTIARLSGAYLNVYGIARDRGVVLDAIENQLGRTT